MIISTFIKANITRLIKGFSGLPQRQSNLDLIPSQPTGFCFLSSCHFLNGFNRYVSAFVITVVL